MHSDLLVKLVDHHLFLKGDGWLTANTCDDFKTRVYHHIEDISHLDVFLDLSSCEYMDSTFMGVIIGIYKRTAKTNGNHFYLVNPSEEACEHLRCMGIDKIIPRSKSDVDFPSGMEHCEIAKTHSVHDVLTAHMNLSELNEENKQKFQNLIDILEKQSKNQSKEK